MAIIYNLHNFLVSNINQLKPQIKIRKCLVPDENKSDFTYYLAQVLTFVKIYCLEVGESKNYKKVK